jgi:two-component system, NarL family, nitrate/nitrite response regulator NarL
VSTVYHRPRLRAHRYRSDLPTVVAVHDNRFVAPGLRNALAGRAEVVGDTAYGAAALQLAGLLTPDVVVAGELVADGAIDHFLPELVRSGMRVLLLVDELHTEHVAHLVAAGLSGACLVSDGLPDVAGAVLALAAGGTVLPPPVGAAIVTQWRSRLTSPSGTGNEQLTLREMEVLNAMTSGLSSKATARLLGVALKTVESHKTRIFAKLGVRNQAQLVSRSAPPFEEARSGKTWPAVTFGSSEHSERF